MKSSVVIALALSPFIAGEAWACSILPPVAPPMMVLIPGEPQEETAARSRLHYDGFAALQEKMARDAEAARQAGLWDDATAVAIVEVVSMREDVKIEPFGSGRAVRFRPLGWIKGAGKKTPAEIAHTSFTSCGATPWWNALAGQPGERFVVFYKGDGRTQADISDAMSVARVTDGRIIAAMAAKVR